MSSNDLQHQLLSKRLNKELAELRSNLPPLVKSAGPVADNLCKWEAVICGPEGSVYEGGSFRVSILFPSNYPSLPPKVQFLTKIFHSNISSHGKICLDLLRDDKWSPALTVGTLLTSIVSLLNECNPNDPLQPTVAQMYITQREKHDDIARKWTKKYAS